jgi:deazaflavin-dependent oxidoreductase (nitroreductase family)
MNTIERPQSPDMPTARNKIPFPPFVRRAIRFVARFANPLVLAMAGRRWMPIVGILHHRGRRSGHAYVTPLGMRPLGATFVMPRTFSEDAAWYKNVQASGWCLIKWGGVEHTGFQPAIVDKATAKPAFPRYERVFFLLLGIDEFLMLQRTPTGWAPPAGGIR